MQGRMLRVCARQWTFAQSMCNAVIHCAIQWQVQNIVMSIPQSRSARNRSGLLNWWQNLGHLVSLFASWSLLSGEGSPKTDYKWKLGSWLKLMFQYKSFIAQLGHLVQIADKSFAKLRDSVDRKLFLFKTLASFSVLCFWLLILFLIIRKQFWDDSGQKRWESKNRGNSRRAQVLPGHEWGAEKDFFAWVEKV